MESWNFFQVFLFKYEVFCKHKYKFLNVFILALFSFMPKYIISKLMFVSKWISLKRFETVFQNCCACLHPQKRWRLVPKFIWQKSHTLLVFSSYLNDDLFVGLILVMYLYSKFLSALSIVGEYLFYTLFPVLMFCLLSWILHFSSDFDIFDCWCFKNVFVCLLFISLV